MFIFIVDKEDILLFVVDWMLLVLINFLNFMLFCDLFNLFLLLICDFFGLFLFKFRNIFGGGFGRFEISILYFFGICIFGGSDGMKEFFDKLFLFGSCGLLF